MRQVSGTKQLLKWVLEISVIVALLLGIRAYMQRDAAEGEAPAIAGLLLDGNRVDISQYRGAPLLVHFWASWCGICRLAEEGIDELARDHAVLTIAMQSGDDDSLRAYLHQQQLSFPVLSDPQGDVAASYGVGAVPASFIIDAEGRIRFVEFGYSTALGLRLRLWLTQWL